VVEAGSVVVGTRTLLRTLNQGPFCPLCPTVTPVEVGAAAQRAPSQADLKGEAMGGEGGGAGVQVQVQV
jgi:hypothetical protein